MDLTNITNLTDITNFKSGSSGLLAAPTGLTATNEAAGVKLDWTNVAVDATGVQVFVSTDNIIFSQLGSDLGATIETYTHDIHDGVLRYYKVAAIGGKYSNLVYEVGWVYFEMESVQPTTLNQVKFEYDLYPDGDVWIDWGNSTVVKLTGGFDKSETSDYAVNETTYTIQIFGELATIKRIKFYQELTIQTDFDDFAKFPELVTLYWWGNTTGSTGTTNNLPSTLIDLYLRQNNNVTLTFANLPSGLEKLYDYRTMPTDSLADLPTGLRWFQIDKYDWAGQKLEDLPDSIHHLALSQIGSTSGTGADLPPNLVYLHVNDYSDTVAVSIDDLNHQMIYLRLNDADDGDIKNLASTLRDITLIGDTLTVTSATYPVWADTEITIQANLLEADVDLFLNNWDDTCGDGAEDIDLAGTNAARSSASDAAVTDMTNNKSKTFTFNT